MTDQLLNHPLNQAAAKLLAQAGQPPEPMLPLVQLLMWGVENVEFEEQTDHERQTLANLKQEVRDLPQASPERVMSLLAENEDGDVLMTGEELSSMTPEQAVEELMSALWVSLARTQPVSD